ncbi:alkaline phosphatase family protein [Streptomyces sp. NPDC006393]|uniref:alkaline phosphatase family protein n=1 Tax=Streptomyces sp. NPDC006393 TaxID=3156763 RepID=UPI0033FF44B2
MTVYWVVWDGAAHWVVDRLEREGALPAVGRMRRHGAFGAARPARPNCQTPSSLATLFTGTWPREHHVTGFTVPVPDAPDPAAHTTGFAPGTLAVPPVWHHLAATGHSGAFVHVPWVIGADGTTDPAVAAAIESYSNRLARPAACELRPGTAFRWYEDGHTRQLPVTARAGDGHGDAGTNGSPPPTDADPDADPGTDPGASGHRTGRALDITVPPDARGVRVTAPGGRSLLLRPGGGWQPLMFGPGPEAPGTWLACFRADGRPLLVRGGVWRTRTAGTCPVLRHRLETLPPFAGESAGSLYRAGTFGPRLADGGDGSAEDVLLSSLDCVARSFAAATDAVLTGHHTGLVVVYLPMTDDAGHELLGWCDPGSGAHRPDIADAVWTRLRRAYQGADTILGRVLDRAGEHDTVLLGADHGMTGTTALVHLNGPLLTAGLATADRDGTLDARRSQVFYHPANNGLLCTGPQGSPTALARAMTLLGGLTDPATGRRVVTAFLDDDGRPTTAPDATGAVYVALADDYQPSAQPPGDGPPVTPARKPAAHVVNTGSDRLHAVFAATGPGIGPGTRLGTVDNTLPARLVLGRLAATARARTTAGP